MKKMKRMKPLKMLSLAGVKKEFAGLPVVDKDGRLLTGMTKTKGATAIKVILSWNFEERAEQWKDKNIPIDERLMDWAITEFLQAKFFSGAFRPVNAAWTLGEREEDVRKAIQRLIMQGRLELRQCKEECYEMPKKDRRRYWRKFKMDVWNRQLDG